MRNGWFYLCVVPFLLSGCSSDTSKALAPTAPPTPTYNNAPIQKGDLIRAIVNGDFAKVLGLIKAGANVNENIGDEIHEITPIIAAIALDEQKIAFALLDHGAAIHSAYQGYSALDFSIFKYGGKDSLSRALRKSDSINNAHTPEEK